MAQPKTGQSHTRGSYFIGSGLYVSGPAHIVGNLTGSGLLHSVMLGRPSVTTHAAASGTPVEGWAFVPARAITLQAIGMHFGTAPQGNGPFSLKIFSQTSKATLTPKGICSASVAGTQKVLLMSNFSAAPTFPAGNAVVIAVKAVGATVAGRGGKPTLHYIYH